MCVNFFWTSVWFSVVWVHQLKEPTSTYSFLRKKERKRKMLPKLFHSVFYTCLLLDTGVLPILWGEVLIDMLTFSSLCTAHLIMCEYKTSALTALQFKIFECTNPLVEQRSHTACDSFWDWFIYYNVEPTSFVVVNGIQWNPLITIFVFSFDDVDVGTAQVA